MALPTHYWLHLMVINEHIHKHNVLFVQHRDHTKQMLKRLFVSPTNGGISVCMCASYLCVDHTCWWSSLWSSRSVGCSSYVLFCMLLCAISPNGHTEIPWCVSESPWGHYVLLQHSPDWVYRLYVQSCTLSSCHSSRLKKNLVRKCKTSHYQVVFFNLDEVWVALTLSRKFKQTRNTVHTNMSAKEKLNVLHSFF